MTSEYDPSGNRADVRKRFPKDVKNFKMRVIADSGIVRVLNFNDPGGRCNHFTIATYPGTLVFTGDMGNYVFQRVEDMFEFFRRNPNRPDARGINPQYWAKKVVAEDRHGRVEDFSPRKFEDVIAERLRDFIESSNLPKSDLSRLRAEVRDELLGDRFSSENEAREAVNNFEFSTATKSFDVFPDLWESDLTDYGYHYLWCITAIVWAIEMYDAHKDAERQLPGSESKE